MSTFTAILEPHPDGTLHFPLPAELRHGKFKVVVDIEAVEAPSTKPTATLAGFGCLRGKLSMSKDFDEPLEGFEEYR